MPLLQAIGFLLGLVIKLWMIGAIFCYEVFLDMFSFAPLAYIATAALILFVAFIAWACAKGIYG
jgi:hypothetical protein